MKKRMLWIILLICIGLLSTGCASERIKEIFNKEIFDKKCMIEDCEEKVYQEGLCQEHYQLIYEKDTAEETESLTENEASDETMAQGQDLPASEEETALPAETAEAEPESQPKDLEEEIRYIRNTYTYANTYYTYEDKEHSLRQKNGYDGGDGVSFSDGFSYYDVDGNLIKLQREDPNSGIRVEAYYINPALGREVPEINYLDTIVVFAFATDANGREYRLYFSNGKVIRYIGPDKEVVDYSYPDGLNWMEFSITGSSLSGGEQIGNILMLLSPTWYIPYETGDDDFFEEDPASVLNIVNEDILASILSRELFQIYNKNYVACNGTFTKEYVQEAAWDYLYSDYYNASMLMPENPANGYPYAENVYYDLDKVNALMENIYGISRILAPGDVCYHLSYKEIALEVSGNRVATPMYGGDRIDPFAIAEITDYSFQDGYLDISGHFAVECGAGPITGDVSMSARFKVNPGNDFPYQLLSCDADAE